MSTTNTHSAPASTTEGGSVIHGFTRPDKAALQEVRVQTEQEREWLDGQELYFYQDGDITRAVGQSALLRVEPTMFYRPIARFLNPLLETDYPPYLRPAALAALYDLASRWRDTADGMGVSLDARLAITSLARTSVYQEQLIAAGKLATRGSSHTAGLAFDIDRAGYYHVDKMQNVTAVSLRPDDFRTAVGGRIMGLIGAAPDLSPAVAGPEAFDPQVTAALELAVMEMHDDGLVNAVFEFDGGNACLHVGVNPDYLQQAA